MNTCKSIILYYLIMNKMYKTMNAIAMTGCKAYGFHSEFQ